MKIIIYALGQIFEIHKDRIDWRDVEALCDKGIEDKRLRYAKYGKPMIAPDELCGLEYDFVVVFSSKFFEGIKQELTGEYAIPKDKIISWRELTADDVKTEEDILEFCRRFFQEKGCKRILDVGMSILPKWYLAKAEVLSGEDIVLDGISGEISWYNSNLYDHVYKTYGEMKGYYDAAVLWKGSAYGEADLEFACKHAKYILFTKRRGDIFDLKNEKELLQKYGNIKCISTAFGDFWIIDTEHKSVSADVSIFVVTHKRYHLNKELPYIPLCVGDYRQKGYLSEQEGENIAYLNKKINECTALYWIWKNTKSEYVGLNHYRRYFYNNEIESMDNYLDMERLIEIFRDYDIILPKTEPFGADTVLEQLRNTMDEDAFREGYNLIRKKIKEKQPGYLDAFDSVMDGHIIFKCNIFVTKREILNRYCEWLFSFLIEAAEEINVEGYDTYSQRVIGFFAERMWTVWLSRNKLRIKELPYVTV